MSVIPGGSNPVPDGAFTSGADLATIQGLTEQDVRDKVFSQVLQPWRNAHGSFFGDIIGGIGQAIQQGIDGTANSVGDWASQFFNAGEQVKEIHDGQMELSDRQDLVDDLLNTTTSYCSAMQNYSANVWTRLPFDTKLGIARGCEPYSGGIRLLRKGQWNIWAHVYLGNMFAPFNTRDVEWEVRVYVPGEVPSGPWALHSMTAGRVVGNAPDQAAIVTSVVTDSEVAHVEVWARTNMAGKTFAYGPSYMKLIVQQVTSERIGADGSEPSGLPDDSAT